MTTFPTYKKSRLNWKIAVPLAWIAICVLWFAVSDRSCPPTIDLRSSQPISYAEVLDTHTSAWWFPWNSPFVVCGTFNLVGLLLIVLTRDWKIFFLMVPVEAIAFLSMSGAYLGCGSGITLQHVGTVEFDGRTYHLAVGDEISGDFLLSIAFLFECSAGQNDCHGREIENAYDDVSLTVDENQLRINSGTQLVFSLDPHTRSNTLPKQLAVITSENLHSLKPLITLHYDTMRDLAWSSDGTMLAAGGSAGTWLHTFTDAEISTTAVSHLPDASVVAFRPNNHLFAFAGLDYGYRAIHLWDVETQTESSIAPNAYPADLAFSPDGKWLVTQRNQQVVLYDGQTFEDVGILGMQTNIYSLAFDQTGKLLAAAEYDQAQDHAEVRVWDVSTRREIFYWGDKHAERIAQLAFDPMEGLLAIPVTEQSESAQTEYETRIELWDISTTTKSASYTLAPESREVTQVLFSPDGDLLFTVTRDNYIRVWNESSAKPLLELKAHRSEYWGGVNALALNPAGTILASAGSDGKIILWGIAERTP